MNKENRWLVGLLLICFGAILLFLFILCSEQIEFLTKLKNLSIYTPNQISPITNLINYTSFFLISGLILSIIGFLFIMITLYQQKGVTIEPEINNKIRITLILVTVLFIIIIGYLLVVDYEWKTDALIIHLFDYFDWFNHPPHLSYPFYPVYALYYEFTITSFYGFFSSLLLFGIFVLPFIIAETGILDNITDEKTNTLGKKDIVNQKAEDQFDQFATFLKSKFYPIMKIRKYFKFILLLFIIFGICLSVLPYFFVKDGPWVHQDYDVSDKISYKVYPFYLEDPDAPIDGWFVEDYQGYLRGQLLLIGFSTTVIGLILIIKYLRHKPHLNP